ncbi:MAG: protein kinase [Gemmatimonadales bacterium]|jgi:hypothetical protein
MDLNTYSAGGSVSSPHSRELVGGTLMLQHAYEQLKLAAKGALFHCYTALQQPFERPVRLRVYYPLDELGFEEVAHQRIRDRLAAGGDGDLAIDFGELEGAVPFLVLRTLPGQSARTWWNRSAPAPARLARLGVAVSASSRASTPAQRVELTLDRLFVDERADALVITLDALGEYPTRAEVRQMSRLVVRELVLGFPPECFDPARADEVGLERQESADVYRLGAILYELATGHHPYFRSDEDVADSVAELVNELGRRPQPPATGSARLDAVIMSALRLDPQRRPSLAELHRRLGAVSLGEEIGGGSATAGGQTAPRHGPRRGGVVLKVLGLAMLLLASSGATYYFTHQPPREVAIILTSDPPGMTFQRIDENGQTERLGPAPVLIEEQAVTAPIRLQPIYGDGTLGTVQTVRPDMLEAYDACRSLHVKFQGGRNGQQGALPD